MIITPELKDAADALAACANFSRMNPDVSLRNNPHNDHATRTHRKATGSINRLWHCSCGNTMPLITDDLRTVCCGQRTVEIR